ncbi:ribosomal L1 domain-containing protein 1 [Rhineura floridana]|uniref:ribosomal L1 domain-containing protein 1 n=1 Tax=Rhineura floridana TaxID=261503 RepID=UPI002AC84A0F|nr:ribosomal L1 domain-containing protein 1 [Rhineura floridana]
MVDTTAMADPLDYGQIKKAAQALLAYNANKQKTAEKLLLNENQKVFLMITVWKIPPREQVIKITLPHGILPETSDVCLFTKDEPGLTAEQTENLYKKLLSQHGITRISEVISYKTLKKEYKPYEAKRRLLSQFSLFLADDRIRRLLPSHIGKHFYTSKKVPLSVNLKAKDLAKEISKHIQGTTLPVTNKGCCYTVRVGHSGMEAWKISQNVIAAAKVIGAKAPQIWKSVKILHLKMERSVALPVFTCSNPKPDACQKQPEAEVGQETQAKKKKKNGTEKKSLGKAGTTVEVSDVPAIDKEKEAAGEVSAIVEVEEDEDGEIPQLVPIEASPSVNRETVAEPNPATGKEVKTGTKGSMTLLGKRKTSPSPGTPKTQLGTPGDGANLRLSQLLGRDKKPKTRRQSILEKEQAKTPQKPQAKSSVTPKLGKFVRSAKKASKTAKRGLGKRTVPQSA